jgi:hypothetical protein
MRARSDPSLRGWPEVTGQPLVNFPGYYLRHYNFQVVLNRSDGSSLFADDATFCAMTGHNGQGVSWQAYGYEDHYLRHFNGNVYIGADGGPRIGDAATSWADDTSWRPVAPLGRLTGRIRVV